jgi:endogenous inhibitor of DNA gyrase (YacG/DUF329 family)
MATTPRPRVCVFCRTRPVEPAWRPFCSERCQLLDLARWVDGSYRAPGAQVDDESDPEKDPGPDAGSR